MQLHVNTQTYTLPDQPDRPLLDVLRDELGLTGTHFGCGAGQCGACTVLLDAAAARSCQTMLSTASQHHITTIEGLSDGATLHPVQQAFVDEQVPQCGYCMSGQIMAAVGLLNAHPQPTEEELVAGMRGNLCRCGTYDRIRRAIARAAGGQP